MIGEVTVTIVSTTTDRDDDGNSTTTTTETDVPGCLFAPDDATVETQDGSSAPVVARPALYMPAGSPVPDADDQVRVDGVLYAVVGDPADWGDGVRVALTRWGQT